MITLSPKDPAEVISLTFDYAAILSGGETVASVSVSLAVRNGADPDVGTMLAGGAIIDGNVVSHLVRNGVHGVDYLAACLATTSQGQVLKIAGILPARTQA